MEESAEQVNMNISQEGCQLETIPFIPDPTVQLVAAAVEESTIRSPWGPLWDKTIAASPQTKIWAGLSMDMNARASEVVGFLATGGSPFDWIVAPHYISRGKEALYQVPDLSLSEVGVSDRLPSVPNWRPPTEDESCSVAFQALPLMLGLLVWAAFSDLENEFNYNADSRDRRAKSVELLTPLFSHHDCWWPKVWREALADNLPAPWKDLTTIPVGRVLWNNCFKNRPDRHSLLIDRLPLSGGQTSHESYVESPLNVWVIDVANSSRQEGLKIFGKPQVEDSQFSFFWNRVHPNLWLDLSNGTILESWLRGLNNMSLPLPDGTPPAIPSIVVLLEARDMLRGAIRLGKRPKDCLPYIPFDDVRPPHLSFSLPPTPMGSISLSLPADFLVRYLVHRLGPRAVRTLPIATHHTVLDEWVGCFDSSALIESARCGWSPSSSQMRKLLQGCWSVRGLNDECSENMRQLLKDLTPVWWSAQMSYTPLSHASSVAMLSSMSLNSSPSNQGKKSQKMADDVLRWCAPASVLLRPLRARQESGEIFWPNARTAPAYHPWLEARDDLVRLSRIKSPCSRFSSPSAEESPVAVPSSPSSNRRRM